MSLTALEIVAVTIGVAEVWLEYRASIWLWLLQIIMPLCYLCIYCHSRLYVDAGICVVYIFVGIYGWICWLCRRDKVTKRQGRISHMPLRVLSWLVPAAILVFIVAAYLLVHYTDTPLPIHSAGVLALSLSAMWLLSQKYAEQWLVCIILDLLNCYVYATVGLRLTALLFAFYGLFAIFGYLHWARLVRRAGLLKASAISTQ